MDKLTLDVANKIIAIALASARRSGMRPMALVVLDEAGLIKAVCREDDATSLRIDIAHGKAAAAFGMGIASRTLLERAKENPLFFGAISAMNNTRFVPQTGAVLIVSSGGAVLGAIGASGGSGDEDEQICIQGIEAMKLLYR
ncbi:Domain of uncharacterised function (DUF336) [Serratia quinivorans]|uniref:GlcG/HbpS family heme-binding protein n=1 Tax=Serratia quinivorans TaxID=137545 RepID=UPI0021783267|nr:heme-binding protein [Serratia quinivorans]CAI1604981.1 Domain of uncharacterised function (DUF336) [Serratia quinivorans]